ncbi:MAG: NAD(P)/FAD-dependent oxidoreductase, partial [Planctomycetes bacterium]|nr:NAD(P)/FAD-dependent oxidoreductase [Planctomycetota bacterium]
QGTDVASGTSKANSGIVHAGYDAKPGSLKAKYNIAGNPLFDSLAEELDFPFRRSGSLVLAFSPEELSNLESLRERGRVNGVSGLEIFGRDRLPELEPNLSPTVCAALFAPTGGIVCPYEMTIAHAENAAANGVEFRMDSAVRGMQRTSSGFRIFVGAETMEAKIIVNAAGLHADAINNSLSRRHLEIMPRRGEYCLLDRSEAGLVRHTLFQLPNEKGKGVLITPTVEDTVLLGPTSEFIDDKDDLDTTSEGLAKVLESAARNVVRLPLGKVIASFAGNRPHLARDDFLIEFCPDVPGLINICGIESPGLTAAPAIALEAGKMLDSLIRFRPNEKFHPLRRAPARFRLLSNAERRKAIAGNPDYGHMICRCELVSKAEVLAAIRSPVPARDLDAVKRRTRAGMGRCQGGFCSMRLPEIIAGELGIAAVRVSKLGAGSELLCGKNKAAYS